MIALQVHERILVMVRRKGPIASILEGEVWVKAVGSQGRGRCARPVVCRLESGRRRCAGKVEGTMVVLSGRQG